jgi:hypothetical protein
MRIVKISQTEEPIENPNPTVEPVVETPVVEQTNNMEQYRNIGIREAVDSGDPEIVKYIMSLGRLPTTSSTWEAAIRTGNLEIVKLVTTPDLIKSNKESYAMTVLDKAVSTENMEIIQYIISLGIIPTQRTHFTAIRTGDLDLVKYIESFDQPKNIMGLDPAVRTGNLDLVKHLVESGLSTSSDTFNSAMLSGNIEMVKYVMSLGCKGDIYSLSNAIKSGSLDLVKFSDELGGRVMGGDFEKAVATDNLEIVKHVLSMVIRYGAYRPTTIFNATIPSKNMEMIKYVGDQMQETDKNSYTDAIKTGDIEILNYVESLPPQIPYYNLNDAIKTGNLEMAKHINSLADTGASSSTLSTAIQTGNIEMVKYAHSIFAQPDRWSLDYAIGTKDPEIVDFIISLKADIGSYSLFYAIRSGNVEILDKIEDLVIEKLKQDISLTDELLNKVQTEKIVEVLMENNFDLSKSNDLFASRDLCEGLSEYTSRGHYSEEQFQKLFFEDVEDFKADHTMEIEMPANQFNRLLLNQVKFIRSHSAFNSFMNEIVNSSGILNEALRTKDKKEVQKWLMQMSTKGPLNSEHESIFSLASQIPKFLEKRKKELEEEGMVEINQAFPKGDDRSKNQERFNEIKKLRNRINNQTRIPFTKNNLKEIDIIDNNKEYSLMKAMVDNIPEDKRDDYQALMVNLIKNTKGNFLNKEDFVKGIVKHPLFGVAKIPAQTMNIEVEGKNYKFEILDKKDPLGVVIGEPTYSGCCFTTRGESKDSLREAYVNPKTGILSVHDDKGKFLAQSWVWLTKDGKSFVLDNVEFATWIKQFDDDDDENILAKIFTKKAKEEKEVEHPRVAIQEAYREFAKQYKAQSGLNIFVGAGYDSLGLDKMGLNRIQNWYVI